MLQDSGPQHKSNPPFVVPIPARRIAAGSRTTRFSMLRVHATSAPPVVEKDQHEPHCADRVLLLESESIFQETSMVNCCSLQGHKIATVEGPRNSETARHREGPATNHTVHRFFSGGGTTTYVVLSTGPGTPLYSCVPGHCRELKLISSKDNQVNRRVSYTWRAPRWQDPPGQVKLAGRKVGAVQVDLRRVLCIKNHKNQFQ